MALAALFSLLPFQLQVKAPRYLLALTCGLRTFITAEPEVMTPLMALTGPLHIVVWW